MSRFFNDSYASLKPYTPGEQPSNTGYNKLNTNESPFPPAPQVMNAVMNVRPLQLYSDPECKELIKKIAEVYNVNEDQVIVSNGSDEILYFSFLAFGRCGASFPDITYGFYPVFAEFTHTAYDEIPLNKDFKIDVRDYIGLNRAVFIANPNAPTGLSLGTADIERIIQGNPNNVLVIDEAYVDFGGKSCIKLIDKYENLLVVRTFSKSRSLAGARLGFAFGNPKLIQDLNTIRFSTNPYNVNSMTMAAGIASLNAQEYTKDNCRQIIKNREYTIKELTSLGFSVLPSDANFIFASHPEIEGAWLYRRLKERKILVRHFEHERIKQYNRITIGSMEQMCSLIDELRSIIKEDIKK